MTDGFTGAEIEAVFLEAMFAAFERSNEPTDLDIATAANSLVPLSTLMKGQLAGLRQWFSGHARPAATPKTAEPKVRKLALG